MGANSTISFLFYFYILFSVAIAELARCASTEFEAPKSNTASSTSYASPQIPSNKGCSMNLPKLAVCSPLLNLPISLLGLQSQPCCATLQGLLDVELSLCLCLAIKANILGINVNAPIALNLLLDTCKLQTPINFQCP